MRKDGDHVRIAAQLVDVATGSHLWAERYDRDLADVFAVQDEITQAVVAAIEPQLYAAENFRARRKTPDNMDAWDLVMRALSHYWRVTRQDNLVAQALLEKAIAVDPAYGQALSLLAACHTFAAHMGWEEMSKAVPVAERAALAAIRADSEDAWAHYALASVYLFYRRFDDCLAEFELALRLNPSFSPARGIYGVALSYRGRWEEGDRAARDALKLSPRDPFAAIYCGVAAYCQYIGGELRRGDPPVARSAAAAHRFCRRPSRADGGPRHGRRRGRRQGRARGAAPRPAQPHARLAGQRTAVRARRRQGALRGRISARGPEIVSRRYLKHVWTVNHSRLKVFAGRYGHVDAAIASARSVIKENDMPLIEVHVIENVFNAEQKRQMITKLTDAMVSIEGEAMRGVTWVKISEVASGEWGIGGQSLTTEAVKELAAGRKVA